MSKQPVRGKFALISLGCPKNLVDLERMAGLLKSHGYRHVPEPSGADFVLINTCGFIGDARAESHAAIREMLSLKRHGRLRGVIVTGCLAERDRDRLLSQFPQIDQLVGVFGREEIDVAADRVMGGLTEQRTLFRPAAARPPEDTHRLRITPKHLAFLKIAEGCNRLCSFCSIPQMRGPYASKPIEQVVAEAEELAEDGVKELILVAQDTTFFGLDFDGKPQLAALLRRLETIRRLRWIRLMYLYPMHITDDLVAVIAGSPKILPYLDLPLQHINDEVLRAMRRRVTRAETEALLVRLREGIPRLVLRTTLIAGFPGETDEQFAELLDFVRRQRFERLGAFAYCDEPGTPAATMDGSVPEAIRQERRAQLLACQQPLAYAFNEALIGQTRDVIVDGPVPGEKDVYFGRTYADAPEIDGVVYVNGERLKAGRIIPCEIVASRGYDVVAVVTTPHTPRAEGS